MSGNMLTGSVREEIEIVYAARSLLGVQAVSVHLGDERVDFAAKGEKMQIGSYAAERIVLPMLGIGAQEIFGAEEIEICLHGVGGVYQTDMTANSYEADSLKCASLPSDPFFAAIGGAPEGVVFAEWERMLGFAPKTVRIWGNEAQAFGAQEYTAAMPAAYDGLDFIVQEDRGDAVEALQGLLAQRGFYYGAAEKEFGSRTRAAVLSAQKAYGLLETGSADANLIGCLESGAGVSPVFAEEEAAEAAVLGDEIAIGCGDWWVAKKVAAPADAEGVHGLTVADSDNELVVLGGEMGNLSAEELGLGWEVKAQLIVDGKFVYDCSLYVESDGGAAFAGTLLPGAWKEMIAAAEVPEGVMDAAQSAQFVFTSGESSFAYDIIG